MEKLPDHQSEVGESEVAQDSELVEEILVPLAPVHSTGTITSLIRQYQAKQPDSEDALWEAVIDQLMRAASQMLYRYPVVVRDPAELMGQLWERLARFLAGYDVANRRHFFNAACRHLRFLLLDIARNPDWPAQDSSQLAVPLDPHPGPLEQAGSNERKAMIQSALTMLDQLDPTLQEIIHYHLFLSMSFREIEEASGIRRATASDRYRRALVELKRLVGGMRGR